jgi:riboflavin kinase/FMN adenylyltransferase
VSLVSASLIEPRFVVVEDPNAPQDTLHAPVVAIGNFDGVHRGHQAVIGRAQALAKRTGNPCAVLTFEPHPANYFAKSTVIFRLTPEDSKALALSRLGLDGMIVLTFDKALAELGCEAFVKDILVKRLGISAAVIGYDFHFGRNRAGTPEFLREAGERYGFDVEVIEKITADAEGDLLAVSSTAVRGLLQAGDVASAARLLGHDYFIVGEVVPGQKLGRTLGFPTANIRLDPSSRLRHGIYAVRVRGEGLSHNGVASFGRRPTFDNGAPLLEVVLFDFSGDLYGRVLEVDFVAWIRGEEKFDGVEPLIARMNVDAAEARMILSGRSFT